MNGNPHRIHRQVLELDLVSPTGTAFALQEQAARPFRDQVLPGLEALFDRMAGPGRLVRLERLEVDLGELRGPDWPEQLLGRLAERLREPLAEAAARPAAAGERREAAPLDAPGAALEQLLYFLEHGRLPWWGTRPGAVWSEPPAGFGAAHWRALGDLLRRDLRARRRLIEAAGDAFLAAAVAALAGLRGSDEVLRLLAPEEASGDGPLCSWRRRFWTRILDVALSGPPDTTAGRRLMRRLLAERRAVARQGTERTADLALPSAPGRDRNTAELPALPAPWRAWFEAAAAHSRGTVPAPPALAGPESARAAALEGEDGPAALPARAQLPASAERTTRPDHGARPPDEAAPAAPPSREERPSPAERGTKPDRGASPREEAAPAAPPAGLRTDARPRAGAALKEGEQVFVPGAGVLILHPFLPELFASRGVLAEKPLRDEPPQQLILSADESVRPTPASDKPSRLDRFRDEPSRLTHSRDEPSRLTHSRDEPSRLTLFRDEPSRQRAVHLLGYLAFGGEAPEYDLLLPKLLCGMPWEELLPPAALDDVDLAACDELLAAVLGHWRALRSSSAAWLREQFFLREGALARVDDGWKLTVERRAQDVLLARLPWGVGTVRLPWLTQFLHVSWGEAD